MTLENTLNDAYRRAIINVMSEGMITAPRGEAVRELLAYKFTIDPRDNVITLPGFETNVDYAQAELDWYYAGTNRIDYSLVIKRTWERFSDDGQHVNSAYGYYLFNQHNGLSALPMSQWDWVIKKLREDPDSRQAVMNINNPVHKEKETKDFPCTIAIQAFIRENRLHWITYMRSQDLYFGTRNDVYCFTNMQLRMARELNVPLGTYTHIMGSMHLYQRHWEKASQLIFADDDE